MMPNGSIDCIPNPEVAEIPQKQKYRNAQQLMASAISGKPFHSGKCLRMPEHRTSVSYYLVEGVIVNSRK